MIDRNTAREVLRTLETCLTQLDELGLAICAAHLDTSIQLLRLEIDGNDTGTTRPLRSG